MKKNLKIFWILATYSLKIALKSPIGLVMFSAGKLVRFSMFFLFIYYLLANTKLLAGYTLTQTVIFYLTYNIIDSLSQVLFREVYRFRPLVISGELDTILVKPYHPFLRILTGGMDILDAGISLIYVSISIYFIHQLPNFQLYHLALYGALILNALIIATGFHIAVLALGILSTEVDHTIMIYRDMMRMGSFPVDIYQQPLRFLVTFVVPIGIMISVPVKSLFDILSPWWYVASFGFSIMTIVFALIVWDFALKKYQSWGG
jgi:ABC-2 type transport system permease protein